MSYSLNSIVINPNSKSSPKNAIIICHGYGGDAKDISIVANYWKTFLTDTLFVCPNAPEICKVNPDGFQWFDLIDQTDDEILSQSLIAENKLNKLIDEVKETNKFKIKGIPTTILLNKNGNEFARIIGEMDFYEERFLKWLNQFS